MPTLILYLNAAPTAASPALAGGAAAEYDFVVQGDDTQLRSHGRASPALLPPAARNTEVVLVLPSRSVSWHALSLPSKVADTLLGGRTEAQRVRAVLGGALEEQLLDEAADVHMAVFQGGAAAQASQTTLWVAACQRAWLQSALAALDAVGHSVARIVAEAEPLDAGHSANLNNPAQALLSTAMEPAQLALCSASGVTVLPLGDAAVALLQAHSNLEVLAEPAVMGLAEKALGTTVQAQTLQQSMVRAAQSRRNLAQLEFTPSRSGRALKRFGGAWQTLLHAPQWRPVRWGLVALLVSQVVALNAVAYRQQTLLAQKRNSVEGVLTQTFPKVPVVVDAPVQMQREVSALAQSRGAVDMDVPRLLSAVGAATGNAKPITAVGLSGAVLQLKLVGLTEADGATVNAALGAQGWSARVQGDALLLQRKEGQ